MLNKLIGSIRKQISDYKINNSLPGKWKLIEYYTEPGNELLNFKEKQIESENISWDLTFSEDGGFSHFSNLNIPYLKDIDSSEWSKSKNFLTLLNKDDFRKNKEFQFAFEKGNLKLLKKDGFGKIVVFAFFKRIPEI
ncbi:MAG: hypothetical protein JXR31_13290 [Prolixibacteraceae bacterium]|nr:hypothetical protein [Prolixibacteraceae bacterium]MBN2775224.1 hypothetical protein [Prolixibacteraceae bacterium]